MAEDTPAAPAPDVGQGLPPAPENATPAPSDWATSLSTLPEDLRADTTVSNSTSLEDMARRMVNANKLVGANRVAVPDENATDDQLSEFYASIGRPATPEDYQLRSRKESENSTAPIVADADVTKISTKLHEIGLTTRQAAQVLSFYEDETLAAKSATDTMIAQSKQDSVDTLKKEFGAAFDAKVELARAAVRELGGDELATVLTETGLGDNPEMVKLMAKVGAMMGEDRLVGKGRASTARTPEMARQELAAKQANKEWNAARLNPMDPMHKQASEEFRILLAESQGTEDKPLNYAIGSVVG